MKRERDLELRLRSLRTLRQAVLAMKGLSAHHFRVARRALEPAESYREGVNSVLESTGASMAAGDGPVGLVVVGGELGFCGAYNARMASAAAEYVAENGVGLVLCVGRRVAAYLRRLGVPIHRSYPAPTSISGITEALMTLTQDIFDDYFSLNMAGIDVLAAKFVGVGGFQPHVLRLLPIEIPRAPGAPVPRYAGQDQIENVAVRELLYIEMVELLLDALAAEHGARLVATQSAEQWLKRRIAQLGRRLSAARRESSTQEVIEVSAGTRARRGATSS